MTVRWTLSISRDENGIPFQIFYGISANSQAFGSIANARKIIGYAPQDNSEMRFQVLIARDLAAASVGDQKTEERKREELMV